MQGQVFMMNSVSREVLAGIARSSVSYSSTPESRTTQPPSRSISMHRRDSREHAGTTPCRRDAKARAHEPQAICHQERIQACQILSATRSSARALPIPSSILRDGPSALLRRRGVARRKAQSVMVRDLCEIARAPSGAPCAAFVRTPGRAFRSGEKPEVSQLLAGTRIDPGRSPGAARVLRCERSAQAPHLVPPHDASRSAPQWTRWHQCKRGSARGDKLRLVP